MLLGVAAAALGLLISAAAIVLALAAAVICPFLALSVSMLAAFALCLYLAAGAAGVFMPGAVLLCGIGLLCGALGLLSGVFTGYLCYWTGLLFKKLFGSFRRKGASA